MSGADCQRLRPYLLDFVVGELDPAEAEKLDLERHLADCAACRAAVEELRGTGRALEAVKVFDSQLNEKVRKDISRMARLEAEKIRHTRAHARLQAPVAKPVPVAAWVMLILGTGLTLGALWAVPYVKNFGNDTKSPYVMGSTGEGLAAGLGAGDRLKSGQQVTIPEGAYLQLALPDESRLGLRGPAEITLAEGGKPLTLKKGELWLAAGPTPVQVELAPLRKLEIAAQAQAALNARPTEDEAAVVAVLDGTVSFQAPGGEGKALKDQTLIVKQPSGAQTLRASKESETASWRKNLPGSLNGGKPKQ